MTPEEFEFIIKSAKWRIELTNKQLDDPNFNLMWGWPLQHGLLHHHDQTQAKPAHDPTQAELEELEDEFMLDLIGIQGAFKLAQVPDDQVDDLTQELIIKRLNLPPNVSEIQLMVKLNDLFRERYGFSMQAGFLIEVYQALGVDFDQTEDEIDHYLAETVGIEKTDSEDIQDQKVLAHLKKIKADPKLIQRLEKEIAKEQNALAPAGIVLGENASMQDIEKAFHQLDAQKEDYSTEDIKIRDTLRKNVIYPARTKFDPYVFRIYDDPETPVELVKEVLEFLLPNLSDAQVEKVINKIEAEGSIALCSSGENLHLWKDLVISLVEAGMDCSLEVRPAKETR